MAIKVTVFLFWALFLVQIASAGTGADGKEWTAKNSDPALFNWMVGSPPPENRIIRFEDGTYFQYPQMRWSVCHFDQLMPTKRVSRGLSAPTQLQRAPLDGLNSLTFTPMGGDKPMTWGEAFEANFTDGIVVLHRGRIVYERYAGALTPAGRHAAMSMTKSFVGLLGEMSIHEGKLDEKKLVREYIPELAASAFGDATVRQVLDMTTGLVFSEDYSDPNAGIWMHAAAGNPLPKPKDYQGPRTYYQFLKTVKKQGRHGVDFGYKTINTDVLGWLIARVTGKPITEVLSQRIWSRLGMEQDAFISVDSIGTPFAGGGLSAGLRDLARFGQMMLEGGRYAGEQIVPATVIDKIREGGSKEAFKAAGYKTLLGWSYRSMWWISHNDHGAFMARGVHGQSLYIDPTARMVIARFASHPTAKNAKIDPTTLPAYHAMAKHLMTIEQ
ncbi:MAG: serine hydrolase [Acidobacteriota bacterium]|nr:serine hydrolase [Acidobacteriota bacterium]